MIFTPRPKIQTWGNRYSLLLLELEAGAVELAGAEAGVAVSEDVDELAAAPLPESLLPESALLSLLPSVDFPSPAFAAAGGFAPDFA